MRPAKRGGGETEQKPTAHLRRVLENGAEETLVAKKTRDAEKKFVYQDNCFKPHEKSSYRIDGWKMVVTNRTYQNK